jgi:tetratricopeptide (TPR) repeat protein
MLNKIISPDRQKLIIYTVLTVVTLAVFWQVNHYDFINFDDPAYVTENSVVQTGITSAGFLWAFSTTCYGGWNPLIWISYMFDYQLHGLNAGGYHLTNVILHILSTLLLFWLFTRMTGAIWKSAFVAALFALHPLHVESVAWIAERRDVSSAFFWMLTLCLYVYYTEKPVIRRYLLVVFSFICALMSKPMVVTLPVVMILLDYWPLGRLQSQKLGNNLTNFMPDSTNQSIRETKSKEETPKGNISSPNKRRLSETRIAGIIPLWQLWEKIPFFVLSAVISIMILYDHYKLPPKYSPLGSRIANAPVSFLTYLEKTFWPHDLAVFYPFPDKLPLWQILGATILILVISIAVMVMVRRLPYMLVGWLWYAITLLPVIGILPIENYAMADRYTYLPSIGIGIMLAWGIPLLYTRAAIRKKILFPAGLAYLVILSVLTWQQCGYWKNTFELFKHALQVTKDNFVAHMCFGIALIDKGRFEEAIEHNNKAIRLKPDYVEAYNNRGFAYDKLGRYQQAFEDYNKAISLNPNFVDAYYNRGFAYDKLGRYQQAFEDYNKAISLNPNYADAYYKRGIAYGKLGRYQQAFEDYNKVISLNPNYADAYNGRGTIYLKIGQYQQAIKDFNRAIRLNPADIIRVYNNRGILYVNLGQHQLAINDFSKAISLKEDYANAYNNRAFVYFQQGDKISGCKDAKKACELKNCNTLEMAKGKGLCR